MFVRTNHSAIATTFVGLSVCLSVSVHCDHTVHFSADLSLWLHLVQCSGHPDSKACTPTPSRLFQFHLEDRWGMDVQTRRDISRTVEDRAHTLLLSANRKSRRLAQQRMTLSDLEHTFPRIVRYLCGSRGSCFHSFCPFCLFSPFFSKQQSYNSDGTHRFSLTINRFHGLPLSKLIPWLLSEFLGHYNVERVVIKKQQIPLLAAMLRRNVSWQPFTQAGRRL